MRPSLSSSVFKSQSASPTSIMTLDRIHMLLEGIDYVYTSHLSFSDFYCIQKFTMNLVSMSNFVILVILFPFLLLLPQKMVPNIMFLLLIIIRDIVRFI